MSGRVQLEVYAFGPDAPFEGWLVNALERLEVGGSVRVVDVLFVKTDRVTGEAAIFDARGEGLDTMLVPLLDFRLDAGARERATADALAGPAGVDDPGMPAATVRELVDALEPGGALAAVLLEHLWVATLDDAVTRADGTPVVSQFVDARRLSEVSTELQAAARSRPGR